MAKQQSIGSRFFALHFRVREAHSIPVGRSGSLRLAALVIVFGGGLSFNVRAQATTGASASNSQDEPQSPANLDVGEKHDLPILVVRIPIKTTTVDVNATLNDIAMEQVREQEQQRIFGVLPNFYTSYIWNAAPMTAKLKFKLAFRTLADPFAFVVAAAGAGVEQAHGTFGGYGEGSKGYAKRYGGAYADAVSGRMLGSAILPALLHQDPRYFYQGSGTIRSRLKHALLSAVVCRGDNGQLEPNYSHVLGSFGAAGLSNIYRDPQDRRISLTIRNGFIVTGGSAAVNVMREFFSRSATSNVPAFANGKP